MSLGDEDELEDVMKEDRVLGLAMSLGLQQPDLNGPPPGVVRKSDLRRNEDARLACERGEKMADANGADPSLLAVSCLASPVKRNLRRRKRVWPRASRSRSFSRCAAANDPGAVKGAGVNARLGEAYKGRAALAVAAMRADAHWVLGSRRNKKHARDLVVHFRGPLANTGDHSALLVRVARLVAKSSSQQVNISKTSTLLATVAPALRIAALSMASKYTGGIFVFQARADVAFQFCPNGVVLKLRAQLALVCYAAATACVGFLCEAWEYFLFEQPSLRELNVHLRPDEIASAFLGVLGPEDGSDATLSSWVS